MLATLSAREIRFRRGRTALTLLSIVIGVAAVVAVSLSSDSTRRSYEEIRRTLAGRAAWEIATEDGRGLDENLVYGVDQVPGVEAAIPVAHNWTVLLHKGTKHRLVVEGVDPRRSLQAGEMDLVAGQNLSEADGLLVEARFARSADLAAGDAVRLLTRRGFVRLPVVGLFSYRGALGLSKAGTVLLRLPTSQYVFKRTRLVDSILVVLHEGRDEKAVREAVAGILPAGAVLRTPAAQARLGPETFVTAERGLQFGSALMIVLAALIVANTCLMNLSQRRKQLAILRAVGATRGQIRRMLLMEAVALGLLGTLLGTPLGYAAAHYLVAATAQIVGALPAAVRWSWGPVALAATLGPGAALLATWVPVWKASRVSPLEAIRGGDQPDGQRASRWLTASGVLLLAAANGLLWICFRGWLPIALAMPAGMLFLAAVVLVLPALLSPFARAAGWLLVPCLGEAGQLARQQVVRRRMRTSLTVGVLYVAVAAGVGLGTTITNNVRDIRQWFRRTMLADFVVTSARVDPATGQTVDMPDALGAELAAVPGVRSVEGLSIVSTQSADQPLVVVARDFADRDALPLLPVDTSEPALRAGLEAGQVAVGSVLAQRLGVEAGDLVALETPEGTRPFRVAGRIVEYMLGGYVVVIERSAAQKVFRFDGAESFLVRARPGALSDLEPCLADFCRDNGLEVYSFAELSHWLDGLMTGILAGLWGLLGLGFVVAALGIANTVTVNVLEQTREIALLRAVGMTQRQVRTMILGQAILMGVLSVLLGMAVGITTAYQMGLCMQPLLGYAVRLEIPPLVLAGSCAAALATVLVAAWRPARRAARLDLLTALKYE